MFIVEFTILMAIKAISMVKKQAKDAVSHRESVC
jgi:hypothetical protein